MRVSPTLEAQILSMAAKVAPAKASATSGRPKSSSRRSAAGDAPRSKYRNVKTVVDGRIFDSKKEARRYGELKLELQAGLISGLRLQVRFKLRINDELITTYVADFVYVRNSRRVIEDVKGKRTREYLMKKRLMRAFYGIEILET